MRITTMITMAAAALFAVPPATAQANGAAAWVVIQNSQQTIQQQSRDQLRRGNDNKQEFCDDGLRYDDERSRPRDCRK